MAVQLSRRSFFALGAAAAALPSLAARADEGKTDAPPASPAATADAPFLKTVKFEKISIAVGAKEPFKAIHCSDTHTNYMNVGDFLGPCCERRYGLHEHRRAQANPMPRFAACVLKARLLNAPLIHTGDVWDFDSMENMVIVQEAFRHVGEVFYAIGNHEIKGWRQPEDFSMPKWRDRIQPYLPNSVLYASKVMHGVNFVSFDDTGYSFDRQADIERFVKAEFAKGLPVVVAVHEPFFTEEQLEQLVAGSVNHKPIDPKNRASYFYGTKKHERKFVDWMLAQPNMKAVLCGHLHFAAQYRLSDAVTQYMAGAAKNGEAYEIDFT